MPNFPGVFASVGNPIFIVLLLLTPFFGQMRLSPGRFWTASALGIGLSTGLAELGKALPVWHGHPAFPSGHETFGLASGICLVWADIRWVWIVIPLAILLGWGLVIVKAHTVPDLFGALLTGPLPAWAVLRLMGRDAKS